MHIPYVIDNQNYKLADILNAILANHSGQSTDVGMMGTCFRVSFIIVGQMIKKEKCQ